MTDYRLDTLSDSPRYQRFAVLSKQLGVQLGEITLCMQVMDDLHFVVRKLGTSAIDQIATGTVSRTRPTKRLASKLWEAFGT